MHAIIDLQRKNLIHPPKWLPDNVSYLTIMGSQAYGVAQENSDMDIYGFAIPPKEMVFPHLAGEIMGFGRQVQRFEQWQEHHVVDPSANAGKGQEYDFGVYSIVKYFQLLMDNNPNMLDSIFTPRNCVIHCANIGNVVRDNRKMFLHKGSYHKFRGYAFSQMHKMRAKDVQEGSARAELREKFGFDVKFGMHLVRLLDEAEQILTLGDIDLQRSKEVLKAIRRGEWTIERIEQHFTEKERELEKLYHESSLPHSPDEAKIKELLLNCLEEHYGSLKDVIVLPNRDRAVLIEIREILDRTGI